MILFYVLVGLAIAIVGGAIGGFIGIGVAVRRIEPQFLQLNEQIGALEGEQRELRIKYNALEGIYHGLVRWSDKVIGIFERLGATYPDPPHRAAEVD